MKRRILLFLFALGCASLFPETVLVSVSETESGSVTQGIMDGLFESGHIVLQALIPPGGPLPALQEEAASSEAGYIVRASVLFETSGSARGVPRFAGKGQFAVLEALSGRQLGSGSVVDTNDGRETEVDLSRLGFEIGGRIAAAAARTLSGGGSGP